MRNGWTFEKMASYFTDEVALYIAIIGCFVLLTVLLWQQAGKRKRKRLVELKKAPYPKANGIIFGKKGRKVIYSPPEADGHILVCAQTGAGKTTTAISTLRNFSGNIYAIDISGDVSKNTPDISGKLIYEPQNENGTTPYNIFGCIDSLKSSEKQNMALQKLAYLLIPIKPDIKPEAKFFPDNARRILTATLIMGYHKGLDFIPCIEMLKMGYNALFKSIDESGNQAAITIINGFDGMPEAQISSCFNDAQNSVELFYTDEGIKKSLRRPEEGETAIEPKSLEEHSVFTVISEDELELYAPLMGLISSQIAQYIITRNITPESPMILLYWDEFGSLRLEGEMVLAIVRRARKRKTRAMILCQNTIDLTILYGADVAEAILSNMKYNLLLGGLGSPKSMLYFAELIGYKKNIKRSITKGTNSSSRTETLEREFVIEPAELDRQKKDVAILIAPKEPNGYLKLKKKYYFKK